MRNFKYVTEKERQEILNQKKNNPFKRTKEFSKQYNLKTDGSTSNLCTPSCVGYTFNNWKL